MDSVIAFISQEIGMVGFIWKKSLRSHLQKISNKINSLQIFKIHQFILTKQIDKSKMEFVTTHTIQILPNMGE